jgi:hypothetical protein
VSSSGRLSWRLLRRRRQSAPAFPSRCASQPASGVNPVFDTTKQILNLSCAQLRLGIVRLERVAEELAFAPLSGRVNLTYSQSLRTDPPSPSRGGGGGGFKPETGIVRYLRLTWEGSGKSWGFFRKRLESASLRCRTCVLRNRGTSAKVLRHVERAPAGEHPYQNAA